MAKKPKIAKKTKKVKAKKAGGPIDLVIQLPPGGLRQVCNDRDDQLFDAYLSDSARSDEKAGGFPTDNFMSEMLTNQQYVAMDDMFDISYAASRLSWSIETLSEYINLCVEHEISEINKIL